MSQLGALYLVLDPFEFHRAAWSAPAEGELTLDLGLFTSGQDQGQAASFISSYLIFLGSAAFMGELSWGLKTSVPF